jgi:hypothetical protein
LVWCWYGNRNRWSVSSSSVSSTSSANSAPTVPSSGCPVRDTPLFSSLPVFAHRPGLTPSALVGNRARTQRHVWLRLAAASDHEPRRHQLVPHPKGQTSLTTTPLSCPSQFIVDIHHTHNAVELEPDEQVPQLLLPVGRRRRYAAPLPSTHGCGPPSLTPLGGGGESQARA